MQSFSPKEFNRQIVAFGKRFPVQLGKDVQSAVVSVVYSAILLKTPVLTGLARGNWFLTLDQPFLDVTKDVAGVTQTGATVTGQERGKLKALIGQIQGRPLGTMAWISNNLNYIGLLDQGSSQKAPLGIVSTSVFFSFDVVTSRIQVAA